jgi:hypothetical protein
MEFGKIIIKVVFFEINVFPSNIKSEGQWICSLALLERRNFWRMIDDEAIDGEWEW